MVTNSNPISWALFLVFKLALEAQKIWQRIKGYKFIPQMMNRARFVGDEIEDKEIQVA